MPKWSFLVSVLLGLMSTVAVSMRFELQSGGTKCISDDIKTNAMTVGKYSVISPNEDVPIPDSSKLTVRVFVLPFPIQCLISVSVYAFLCIALRLCFILPVLYGNLATFIQKLYGGTVS